MTRRTQIAIAGAAAVLLVVMAGLAFFLLSPSPPPYVLATATGGPPQILTRPIPDSVPNAAQLRRGQYLVRVGDCTSCHTREGGVPFAGGFGLNTPFGVIYSTNITSDRHHGVGALTPEKFYRVLHDGVGPKGALLYPAMPYPYFARVTRADSDAMLAYLKTVPASPNRRPPDDLPFPFSIRSLVGAWNLLFFDSGVFEPDPAKSAQWNRGAYLVTGLGHCGACHTPKNALAGDRNSQALQGGYLDTWIAPDLTPNTRTGVGSWSRQDIVDYLKTGRSVRANAAGPMAEVVANSTSLLSDADLAAIAEYLKDQPASPDRVSSEAPDAAVLRRGAAIFSDACSACHMASGTGQSRLFPSLHGNAMLQQSDPSGLLHLILAGGRTAPTPSRPTPVSMPSFASKLGDRQIADVATYIRNSMGNRAEPVTAKQAAAMRRRLGLQSVRLTDNSGDWP